jgi:tripartite-type tricarboxylate transporter receptor subunit TctC
VKPTFRAVFVLALLAALAGSLSIGAQAQTWPSKPLKLIVPFPPGGSTDILARALGQKLSEGLSQPVVIDNRPGAGGSIGAEAAAKAAPDGYTLFLGGVGSHAINPNLHDKLPYDPIKDFAPVGLLAHAALILVVHPAVPARDIAEFTAYARANPGRLNFASNGNGSSSQLAAVMFDSMAGVDMVHVPYKGLSPALSDLLSGQVQVMFSSVVAILPHVRAGKLRALAVTGARRLAAMPELPTIAESGLAGYEASSWYGILAPAGTPRDIVLKLNAELGKALEQPEVKNSLLAEGAEPVGGSPEAFAAHIRSEKERLGNLIREAKIRLE